MSENSNYPLKCPIWGTIAAEVQRDHENSRGIILYDSPRTGGGFSISTNGTSWSDRNPYSMLQIVDASVKARLTSWLIEQRRLGEEFPEVNCDSIENAKVRRSLRITERADNFLRYLSRLEGIFGSGFRAPYLGRNDNPYERYLKVLSYLESTSNIEKEEKVLNQQINKQILTYLRYLNDKKWISSEFLNDSSGNRIESVHRFYLTVDGYSRLEDLNYTSSSSSQAFVAMWFDSSMKSARDSILLAIKNAGYEPIIIDQKPHINKIDDEIIAEIRRSRFVVADFTQDQSGARGGVYYEAGFAHGLGIPVIFTCQKDWLKKIHFDIRQYNCITWEKEDLKKLQEDLANRITAILGDGPGRSVS